MQACKDAYVNIIFNGAKFIATFSLEVAYWATLLLACPKQIPSKGTFSFNA